MPLLKQSATFTKLFLMILSSDHTSPATGKTVAVSISKAGASGASAAGTVSEVDSTNMPGWYKIALTTADTATLGELAFHCTSATCDPTDFSEQVVAFDPGSATNLGLSALPAVAAGANGGLPTGNASGQVVMASTATGAIAAASFAAGAIDNAAIATDAIGAAELAAGAVTKIQTGLSSLDASGIRTALGLASANLDTQLTTIAGYVDTEVAAIKAKTDLIPSSPAAVGSAMTLDLTQAIPASNTAQTVGDALNAARAQGFGKWTLSGTTLTLYAGNGSTVVRTFTLDSATAPTSRS